MINQFHDILPGSSIAEVYARTEPELAGVVAEAGKVADAAMDALAARLGGVGEPALLVVNPDAAPRPLRLTSDQPILGGQAAEDGYVLAAAETIAPLSAAIVRPTPAPAVQVTGHALENQFLRLELADDGTIASLYDKRAGRETMAGRGNQIWAWRDQSRGSTTPGTLEGDYRRAGEEVLASSIEIVEAGGQRGALKIVRRFGASTIVQSVRLWANSARVDFATRLDWHDRRIFLKARFPLAIRADHATFECAFGVQRRPTHRNTSWDATKFEVAAHRFADLSEPGYGVALLNNGRYGHEALGNELSLSLLRSPVAARPPGRRGRARSSPTRCCLTPAAWWDADVLAEAEDLNRPLFHRAAAGARSSTPIVGLAGAKVGLGALKPAEDGEGLILRLYEPAGARGPVEIAPPAGWRVAGEVEPAGGRDRPAVAAAPPVRDPQLAFGKGLASTSRHPGRPQADPGPDPPAHRRTQAR